MEVRSGSISHPGEAWVCNRDSRQPGISSRTPGPPGSGYAFNRNLLDDRSGSYAFASTLMMVREMDRLVDAELRPTNYSCGLPDVPPDSPFLTTRDSRIGSTNPDLHSQGSNVLFADAHVSISPPTTSRPSCAGTQKIGSGTTSRTAVGGVQEHRDHAVARLARPLSAIELVFEHAAPRELMLGLDDSISESAVEPPRPGSSHSGY